MSTQSTAIKAGLRTAEQALTMGLAVITGGGAILGATHLSGINWTELAGALAFTLLTAFFAGLKSYLSFITNGVPAAYTAPAIVGTADGSAFVDDTADATSDTAAAEPVDAPAEAPAAAA